MSLFNWTGNPFVDTGLAVIIARAKELKFDVKTIKDLTPDIIEMVSKSKINDYSDEFSWLAKVNQRLKSYTMVFTKNGPLFNTSTNPKKTLADTERKITKIDVDLKEVEKDLYKTSNELLKANDKQQKHTNEEELLKIKKEITKLEKREDSFKRKIDKKESERNKLVEKKKQWEEKAENSSVDKGLNEYLSVIEGLVEDIKNNSYSTGNPCEITGNLRASSILEKNNKNIAREWFPLVGTMQDVQTLPSASRSVKLSALSLLAAQFMPMGAAILGGKLVCFQTNDYAINEIPIFQSMVEEIYLETMQKAALTDKIETWGKDGGYNSITYLLLGRLNDLIQRKSLEELPDYICLNLWRFSNSGKDPSLEIIEIPSDAIQFLWDVWRSKLKNEIECYLREEKNFDKKESQLLQCIKGKKEYRPFYPYEVKPKKGKSFVREPASIELFDLYANKVLGYKEESLAVAKWVAEEIRKITKEEDLQKFKEHIHEDNKQIRNVILKLAEIGLSLEDYLLLFPCTIHPLRVDKNKQSINRRIIWFYISHEINKTKKPVIGGNINMFVHPKYPKIKLFAKDFFDYYIAKEGKERFKKRVLTAFKGNQVKPSTVEDWFATLAETKEGYTNEEWDDLCRDENGNSDVWEVLFQLRLELVNLYRKNLQC